MNTVWFHFGGVFLILASIPMMLTGIMELQCFGIGFLVGGVAWSVFVSNTFQSSAWRHP